MRLVSPRLWQHRPVNCWRVSTSPAAAAAADAVVDAAAAAAAGVGLLYLLYFMGKAVLL